MRASGSFALGRARLDGKDKFRVRCSAASPRRSREPRGVRSHRAREGGDAMKRILVALDASDRAGLVLAAAARLAELAGAQLVLFRAINVPPDMPRDVLTVTDLQLEDILKRNAHEDLDRMASTLRAGIVEEITMDFATPWDGICRAGRTHDADLIVIGSHGYSGLDHLLGTTAAKVVNHADRNVLVVRTLL